MYSYDLEPYQVVDDRLFPAEVHAAVESHKSSIVLMEFQSPGYVV